MFLSKNICMLLMLCKDSNHPIQVDFKNATSQRELYLHKTFGMHVPTKVLGFILEQLATSDVCITA